MFAHVDADSFFASVLQRKHPKLRGKALIALGMGGSFVIAATYEAKAKGVKTGMPLKEAVRLCPEALHVPSDFRETGLASEQIETILKNICPVVEQMSIDEWYLDLHTLVGGVPKDLQAFGTDVRTRVMRMTGLSVSTGIAPTKLLAKMAGEYRKPAGVTVLQPADIDWFLRDRPAPAIPGIGRKRDVHAQAHGWKTAWDIAHADRGIITELFGRPGSDMQRELLGESLSSVKADPSPPKSVSRCRSFRASRDEAMIWGYLLQHLAYSVLRMRRHGLACRGVSVWLRDAQYSYDIRHASLPRAADTEDFIVPYARQCFRRIHDPAHRYTQAGLALWQLAPAGTTQFSLFEEPARALQIDALQASLDRLRDRFGRDIICRGSSVAVNGQKRPAFGIPVVSGEV